MLSAASQGIVNVYRISASFVMMCMRDSRLFCNVNFCSVLSMKIGVFQGPKAREHLTK